MLIPGVDLERTLVLLLAALAIEPVFGEARGPLARIPHPVRQIGAVIDYLDGWLNGEELSTEERRFRGALTVVAVVLAAFAVGWLIVWVGRQLPFGWIIELALMISLLAQRSLDRHVGAVAPALRQALDAGRAAVAHIVGRDVQRLDRYGVARAAIESCAENFSDAVIAPACWYLALGLPGMLVYKAVNTMDSMIGHRSPKYLAFGTAAARLDDLMNLLPARLSGLLIAVAAIGVPDADCRRALRCMRRDAGKHRSPNAGWPEAAMAGALGLRLAGPRYYSMVTVEDPWIGDGRAGADAGDIERAIELYRRACVVNGLLLVTFLVAGATFS